MTKSMYALVIFFVVASLLWFLYSWLPVRNIEEPKYEVVSKNESYEIRKYDSYIIAETKITGAKNRDDAARKGFPIVAGYIFGDNTSKTKIAMTAPVSSEEGTSEKIAMTAPVNAEKVTSEKISMTVPVNTESEQDSDTYKISFVMPSKYSREDLPEPNDSRVTLVEVPSRKVAVRRFSWSSSEENFKKQESILLASLERDEVQAAGAVNVARYNTPWTIPFMLRNEVQINIK